MAAIALLAAGCTQGVRVVLLFSTMNTHTHTHTPSRVGYYIIDIQLRGPENGFE